MESQEINKLFNLIKNHKWDEMIEYINSNEYIDFNVRDDHNNYLLTYALLYNKVEIVSLLINRGARIDIVDSEGRSVLYIAIKYDYQDIIDVILNYNKNNIGISVFDIRDRNNNTAIHYAILFNNIEALTKLLEYGASPNTTDKNGFNALHFAVQTRSFNMCSDILKYNVDINARLKSGETALHIACNLQLNNIAKILVENGINVNIQDYEHEFTALHYSTNLNNRELISLLLSVGANANIQDVMGNTVIHYAISENNLESLILILASDDKINLNLWNFEGKIPLMIALEGKTNVTEYVELLIVNSNLNIQDNNGNTCLHIMSGNDLWKEYHQQLIKKKLDIFLPNNKDIRPIDLIKNTDLEAFINMVVDSYLYRLRNAGGYWLEEWENMCTKELYYNNLNDEEKKILQPKMTDQQIKKLSSETADTCRVLVYNKIKSIYNNDTKMCSKSYPLKSGYMCLNLNEGQNLDTCTFTGTTLDILIGLIYLLKKHTDSCSTFSKNFSENKALCRFYKSIGIIMNTRCEFLNFEIVWVQQKLYLVENFYESFKRCLSRSDKRFVIIPIGIELRQGSHANYLLYDKSTKEVERFEPHGSTTPIGLNYNPTLLDDILETRFKEIDPDIKYIRPKDYLPKIGFQLLDVYESNKRKIGDPGGFCALWAIWYIDMRLTYKEINRDKLVTKMIETIKSQNISFRNLIRNYAKNILDIRDKILRKAGLDINDWMNDQHTEHQIDIVLKELVNEISHVIP